MVMEVERALDADFFNKIVALINQAGVANVSVTKMCRELQMSRSLMVANYGNKDELLKKVLAQLLSKKAVFIKEQVESMASSQKQLQGFIQASFEYGYQYQERNSALIELARHYDLSALTQKQSMQRLQVIISEGVANGEFTNIHVELACQFIQGLIDREINMQAYFWEEKSSRLIFYLSVMKMVDKLLL